MGQKRGGGKSGSWKGNGEQKNLMWGWEWDFEIIYVTSTIFFLLFGRLEKIASSSSS